MPKRKTKTESKEDSKKKSKKKSKNKSNSAEKDETIKYMGVTKRVSGRFKAQVSISSKYHVLGMFDTPGRLLKRTIVHASKQRPLQIKFS